MKRMIICGTNATIAALLCRWLFDGTAMEGMILQWLFFKHLLDGSKHD